MISFEKKFRPNSHQILSEKEKSILKSILKDIIF